MSTDFLIAVEGNRTAALKKKIIHYYIANGDATIADLCKEMDLSENDLISIQQIKNGKSYLWPGFIVGRKGIPLSHINFSPHGDFDTGGGTHVLVDEGYKIKWVLEEYLGEPTTGFLQNSKVIIKISDLAVHYLNGSCWMPTSENTLSEKNQFLFETIRSMGMKI